MQRNSFTIYKLNMFKQLLAQLWVTEAWAYLICKQVLKEYNKLMFDRESFEEWIDDKLLKAPDEIVERDKMEMTLYDRLILYKCGRYKDWSPLGLEVRKEWSDEFLMEPLDWDEVEWFIEMLRQEVNQIEGNW